MPPYLAFISGSGTLVASCPLPTRESLFVSYSCHSDCLRIHPTSNLDANSPHPLQSSFLLIGPPIVLRLLSYRLIPGVSASVTSTLGIFSQRPLFRLDFLSKLLIINKQLMHAIERRSQLFVTAIIEFTTLMDRRKRLGLAESRGTKRPLGSEYYAHMLPLKTHVHSHAGT